MYFVRSPTSNTPRLPIICLISFPIIGRLLRDAVRMLSGGRGGTSQVNSTMMKEVGTSQVNSTMMKIIKAMKNQYEQIEHFS